MKYKTHYNKGDKVRVVRESNIGFNGHDLKDNNLGAKVGDIFTVDRIIVANGANSLSGAWMFPRENPSDAICPSLVELVEG